MISNPTIDASIASDAIHDAKSPMTPPPAIVALMPKTHSESHFPGPAKRIIVIGCDDTLAAKRSIDWCLDNVASKDDKLILMRIVPFSTVYPPAYGPSFGMVPMPVLGNLPTAMDELEIQGENEALARDQIMAQLVPAIEERKIDYEIDALSFNTDADWEVSAIARAVCERAEAAKASLIIVSKHNKGMLKSLFTGSVTAKIIHFSKIPVLVFHGDHDTSITIGQLCLGAI